MKKFLNTYGLILLVVLIIMATTPLVDDEAGIVAWAILSVTILVILFVVGRIKQQRTLERLQRQRIQSEVALLKSQLNPHFFFNTLNNLYSISLTSPAQTPEMLLKLADLMRYTIYKGKEHTVSLKEEWQYIKNYADLHKIRFKKEPSILLEEQLLLGNTQLPPLLLIVLVENAFKHGIEKLGEDAFAKVRITETDSQLTLDVINNYNTTAPMSQGIGLENLKKRLELQYPNHHSLTIEKNKNTFRVQLKLSQKRRI